MTRPDVPVAVCRSCKRAIYWGWTDRGRRMPLSAAEAPIGTPGAWELAWENGMLRTRPFSPMLPTEGATLHKPHWADCPDADEWRNRK